MLWGTLNESPSSNRLLVTFTPHLLMSRDTHGHQIVTIILEDREFKQKNMEKTQEVGESHHFQNGKLFLDDDNPK